MLYRGIIAVCSEIHTKHINTECGQNIELLNVKLVVHIAMVTEADKGNSMIILYESDYTGKVGDFISNNNFELVPRDVTKKTTT